MANGKGCECGARGECECGCGVDWTPQEVYDLRTENAVLRGCEEILKTRIALLEAKCEFLSRGDAEKYQKTMEEISKGGSRTGSIPHNNFGLTHEEIDTIDGWMEENKTNTTDQTTYWILEETSSLYWVFCLHSHLPNTIFTVDTKTLNAALHYTKIARHLAMGIVWVHGVHHVQQNTLEEAKKLWNDIHLRGANLIYNRINQD